MSKVSLFHWVMFVYYVFSFCFSFIFSMLGLSIDILTLFEAFVGSFKDYVVLLRRFLNDGSFDVEGSQAPYVHPDVDGLHTSNVSPDLLPPQNNLVDEVVITSPSMKRKRGSLDDSCESQGILSLECDSEEEEEESLCNEKISNVVHSFFEQGILYQGGNLGLERVKIFVHFNDKEDVKSKGCSWDPEQKV